jgi:hypothetical protein
MVETSLTMTKVRWNRTRRFPLRGVRLQSGPENGPAVAVRNAAGPDGQESPKSSREITMQWDASLRDLCGSKGTPPRDC